MMLQDEYWKVPLEALLATICYPYSKTTYIVCMVAIVV